MFKITNPLAVVGPGKDIQPFSMSVKPNHCSFEMNAEGVFIIAGEGRTIYNGKILKQDTKCKLSNFDRVAIGADLMIFYDPAHSVAGVEELNVEAVTKEFQDALSSESAAKDTDLKNRMDEFEKMKAMWEEQRKAEEAKAKADETAKTNDKVALAEAEKARAEQAAVREAQMKAMQQEMLQTTIKELVPKLTEAKVLCEAVGRESLSFKPSLFANIGAKQHDVNIRIEVQNHDTEESIQIEVYEFNKALSWLKDEVKNLKLAIDSGAEYTVERERDPLTCKDCASPLCSVS